MNILRPEGQSEPPPPICRVDRPLLLKYLVAASCLVLWASLAWLDLTLGLKVRFGPFYAVPVLLAAWYLGRAWALLSSLVSSVMWHALQVAVLHRYPVLAFQHWDHWDLLSGTLAFLAIAFAASWSRSLFDREQLLNQELQRANDQVKTLEGMLPICAWCRKVRDDQGLWEKIEDYLARHSNTTWTHGICPDCAKRFLDQSAVPPPRLNPKVSTHDPKGQP